MKISIVSSLIVIIFLAVSLLSVNTINTPAILYNSQYPNFSLSPGDILTTNLTLICEVGYTDDVRDVPLSLRKQVFQNYNINYENRSLYELDHIIPLGLGGSNDIKNLFPQAYEPKPGARQKDVIENYLRKEVCNNNFSIELAQQLIVYNWTNIYYERFSNN